MTPCPWCHGSGKPVYPDLGDSSGSACSRCEGSGTTAVPSPRLSPRQREVAVMVAEGMSTREIAAALGLKYQTVKNLRHQAMTRTGTANAVQLALALAREAQR